MPSVSLRRTSGSATLLATGEGHEGLRRGLVPTETPSTLAPAVAKKRTATVSSAATTMGVVKSKSSSAAHHGGRRLWNAAEGTGVVTDRFQISMIGWP